MSTRTRTRTPSAAPPDRPGSAPPVGELLRGWRLRRRLSQLELSGRAEVSTRHLSYVETGRSQPSRDLVLHLAEELDVPLRDRNRLLLAAGYAPSFPQTELASQRLAAVREAIAVALLTEGVRADLLEPPVNVLRVSLHPEGMAPRIVNLDEWREHLLDRLRRQADLTADPGLRDLYAELAAYPGGGDPAGDRTSGTDLVVPLRLRTADRTATLTFVSTVTTFGTPLDVTVSELVIEAFYPADAATADLLRPHPRLPRS
jgi:transcriptional regulator with XRE-family HTH domain